MSKHKLLKPLLGLTAAAVLLPLYAVAPGHASRRQKKIFRGVNYAHRGLHTRDKSVPENSLAAFRQAAQEGYGIELDVQLSKDGEVVVFHDDTLDRICGVGARVDSLDYAGLEQLRLCGTGERIPLFSRVLEAAGGIPLIVELKTGKRNAELCEKTLSLLKGYKGAYCIESFDPTVVAWFRKHAPQVLRGQLAQPPREYAGSDISKPLAFLLGNLLLNFLARPQFIAYRVGPKPFPVRLCEALGAMKVCWTSHDKANEKGCDTVIFEHYLPQFKFKYQCKRNPF